MIDDGFIVTAAVRLDDAANEAQGVFETFGILPPDLKHPAHAFYTDLAARMAFYGPSSDEATVARQDWIGRSFLPTLARKSIENALIRGDMTVWTADETGERPRDHCVLFRPSECDWHKTLVTGRYIPVQGQPVKPPSYVHARLWLKTDEWAPFRTRLLEERGGTHGMQLLEAMIAPTTNVSNEDAQPVGTTAAKGRPLGSGYHRMDESLVKKMAQLLENREVSSVTAAARHVADDAVGASFESKVRRLQRLYSAWEKKGE